MKVIRALPYDLLTEDIQEVDKEEAADIIKLLEEAWEKEELEGKGYGLAAPQIGMPFKVAIIRLPDGTRYSLVNPVILRKANQFTLESEGCLSLDKRYDTKRYRRIKITDDTRGQRNAKGIEALILQHEIDHLNGLTIRDRRKNRWG